MTGFGLAGFVVSSSSIITTAASAQSASDICAEDYEWDGPSSKTFLRANLVSVCRSLKWTSFAYFLITDFVLLLCVVLCVPCCSAEAMTSDTPHAGTACLSACRLCASTPNSTVRSRGTAPTVALLIRALAADVDQTEGREKLLPVSSDVENHLNRSGSGKTGAASGSILLTASRMSVLIYSVVLNFAVTFTMWVLAICSDSLFVMWTFIFGLNTGFRRSQWAQFSINLNSGSLLLIQTQVKIKSVFQDSQSSRFFHDLFTPFG
jgi:hypothetical protein